MPTFATPEPIAVLLTVGAARVHLSASDRTDTVVSVAPVDTAQGKHVEVADGATVDLRSGRLRVETNPAGGTYDVPAVAVTIEVPRDSALVAKTAHTEVQADGPLGDCEVHLASGLVRLDRVGVLTAHVTAGELVVASVTGPAAIDGAAGTVRIDEVAGAVRYAGSSGSVRIGEAAEDLDLSSADGSVEVDRADGNVTAQTAAGAIRIGHLSRGQAQLTNSSGDIEVGIAEGSAAWADATSTKGTVRNLLPTQKNADGFDRTVNVHARTRAGDVVLRRAGDART